MTGWRIPPRSPQIRPGDGERLDLERMVATMEEMAEHMRGTWTARNRLADPSRRCLPIRWSRQAGHALCAALACRAPLRRGPPWAELAQLARSVAVPLVRTGLDAAYIGQMLSLTTRRFGLQRVLDGIELYVESRETR